MFVPKQKTVEEAYCECEAEGHILSLEIVEAKKIESVLALAQTIYDTAQDVKKDLDPKSPRWSVVYTMHYDAIREITDALIRFDKKKITNHQCLFAFLCKNHPELELSWDFFEKIRTKRNGVQYYGSPTTYTDWKEVELQLGLYFNTLKKAVEEKLAEY